MAVAEEVVIELIARTERLEAGLARSKREMGALGKGVNLLKGLLSGLGTAAAAREFLRLADASKQLDAQLRLATSTFGSYNVAQADAQRIAKDSRSGLVETASLYAGFVRAAQDLGKSQGEAAQATETFSKALKIGGASAEDAKNATRQFLQALAGGILRAEEFNSVVEASPRVARLFAEGLNTSVGGLRKLVNEGKVTADQLFGVLNNKKLFEGINNEFKQLPVTFGQAMEQVENAAITTFGAFDRGGGFSTALASFILDGANGFNDLSKKAEDFGVSARGSIEGLASAFGPVLDEGLRIFDALGLRVSQFSADGRKEISDILGAIDDATGFIDKYRIALGGNKQFTVNGQNVETSTNLRGRFDASAAASDRRRRDEINSRKLDDMFGNFATGQGNRDIYGRRLNSTTSRPALASGGAGGKSAASAAKKAEREAAAAAKREQRDAEIAARNAAQYQNDIGALRADEIQYRADLGNSIQADAQARIADLNERRAAYARNIELDKSLDEAKRKELLTQYDVNTGLQTALINQNARKDLERQAADAAQTILSTDADIARSNGELATTREQRLAVELRLIDIAEKQERAALERVVAEQAGTEAARAAQDRLDRIGQVYNNQRASANRNAQGAYARYRSDMTDAGVLADDIDRIKIGTLESVTDELTNATKAALGLKGAFGDIVGELIRIGIQRRLIGPLADRLFGPAGGATGGGSGDGILGGILNLFGGGRASGGNVMGGKIYRINENGPELFQPAQSGKIYPTGQLNKAAGRASGGTVVQQSFTLDARGGVVTQELLRQVNVLATQKASQAGKAAYEASPKRSATLTALGT